MSVINRTFVGDPDDEVAGLLSNRSLDVIEQIRYVFPKTWRSKDRFSKFKSMGEYLRDHQHFRLEYSLCCARSALEVYFTLHASYPSG